MSLVIGVIANFGIEPSSEIFAKNKAILKQQGNLIANMDLMITSITKANGFLLVTNNGKHFDKVENLKRVYWM